MFEAIKAEYQQEVQRICKKYGLVPAIEEYYGRFDSPEKFNDKGSILKFLRSVCGGGLLDRATKCLDELAEIK